MIRAAVPDRRSDLELLDHPDTVPELLPGNLRDIRRLNRFFGGHSIAAREVWRQLAGFEDASLLDVATGSADIPVTLIRQSRARAVRLEVSALDSSAAVLAEARKVVGRLPVRLVQGDARRLPFPDGAFDVTLCCLALHHFLPADATLVLREMWRVTRRAAIIADLRRSWVGYAGAWLMTHAFARNPLTRHDGPLSVLRAYTCPEVRELAYDAGLCNVSVRGAAPFRLVLVARRDG